jgi:hypothetical protein
LLRVLSVGVTATGVWKMHPQIFFLLSE